MSDLFVRCCQCKNEHFELERHLVPSQKFEGALDKVCPRCQCREYYIIEDEESEDE